MFNGCGFQVCGCTALIFGDGGEGFDCSRICDLSGCIRTCHRNSHMATGFEVSFGLACLPMEPCQLDCLNYSSWCLAYEQGLCSFSRAL